MAKLDIAIIVLVTLGGVKCFRAGFTRSVWGIAAISAGLFTANQLWGALAPILEHWIEDRGTVKWVSVIVITLVVSIVIDIVFGRVQEVLDTGVLGWINSLVGGAFGVAASCVLLSIAFMLANRYGDESIQTIIKNSRFGPSLLEIGIQIFDFGKEAIKEQADNLQNL